MLERVTLQKVSGACALLTVVVAIAGLALFEATDVFDATEAIDALPAIDDDKAMIAASSWLFTLAPILLLGTVPGTPRPFRRRIKPSTVPTTCARPSARPGSVCNRPASRSLRGIGG